MNKQKSNKKSILILIIVVLIAAIIYFYASGRKTPIDSALLSTQNIPDAQVGVKVVALFNQVSALKIDGNVFKDPAYLSLRDYTVVIPVLEVGRPNPFAPVPGAPLLNIKK